MELSIRGQRRRAVQTANAASQTKKAPAAGGRKTAGIRADRLELSRQALSILEEANRQERENRRKLLEAKQRGSGEWDALTKSLKIMEKCRKIAARIQAGDKVPPEDEQYLMDHDMEGYKLALAARKPKEKPKEWESVLEKEDREDGGAETAEISDSGGEEPV